MDQEPDIELDFDVNDDNAEVSELVRMIQASSLSEEDKNFWFNGLITMPMPVIEALLRILKEGTITFDEMTMMAKKKMAAIENRDQAAWDVILEQEKKELEALI